MRDPILAITTLPVGSRHNHYRVPLTLKVLGGLHYIKGNAAPYFWLTAEVHRRGFPNQCQGGGADHDLILARFPRFADLAALHLSDINGAPVHGVANGWYWLAGAMGGAGEQYHGGNGTTAKSPSECLATFRDQWRLTDDEANAILSELREHEKPKDRLTEIATEMLPRWKAEADRCIAAHNLKAFGDEWSGDAS